MLHLEVNSDLTARNQAETEVAARVAVESAMRARNDAISTIAHDLKNPLTAIRGQVQLLRRRATVSGSVASDVLDRGLNHIEASAQTRCRATR
jgi:signal transduction histidine kinase